MYPFPLRNWLTLPLALVAACEAGASDSDDTDVRVDLVPEMPAWLEAALPESRSCEVAVEEGQPLADGYWSIFDAEGWPLARIIILDSSSDDGSAVTQRARNVSTRMRHRVVGIQ